MHVCVYMTQCMCGGKRTAFRASLCLLWDSRNLAQAWEQVS